MNWETIGAVSEIIGAIAVVASLFYLAIQIRTQNKESRIAAVQDLVASMRSTVRVFLEPGVADDFLAVLSQGDRASPAQRLRITMVLMEVWKLAEGAYFQYLEGRLDETVWTGFQSQLSDMMANPACTAIWETRCHQFDERFQRFIEELTPGDQIYPMPVSQSGGSNDA